ncbi:MAG: NAD(P)H-hydrate epimerase [Phycisphaerales bacterium]|nr:NAD(P)H-hydrate epimerase [Phycisphaerales bacterium]
METAQSLVLTRQQVRRVDECAVHELHYPSIILMENAGRNAAQWIDAHCAGTGRRARICCGTGNNGGDGFVIARHLHNAGWRVDLHIVGDVRKMSPDAETNHIIARAIGIPREVVGDVESAVRAARRIDANTVVIDALLGTGFSGAVREPMAALIAALNAQQAARVIAIDVPSGLDCDTGEVGNVAVRADATITFVAPKPGFVRGAGPRCAGEVVVTDIGTPPALIDRVLAEDEDSPAESPAP